MAIRKEDPKVAMAQEGGGDLHEGKWRSLAKTEKNGSECWG